EFHRGKWSELSPKTKFIAGIIIGLGFLLFLGYVLLIKVLNALTLSVNAFTTLGFGDIPTQGLARYVAIIQGFIGWFLLSIFSVALINQVLA
ncbi:MAG: ion channel, partial [Bacteroidetes bacterium]|nr:ion channel [Bacteroidota bacterium]